MTPPSFRERLLDHLATYRRDTLGVPTPGTFRHQGRTIPKEHVLPVDQRWLNILPDARGQVQEYVRRHELRLHKHFHHLNSSQGLALGLFVPYFDGAPEAQAALLRALGLPGMLERWQAEAVPDADEGTNLDALWVTKDGITTFCEVKLTENGFGRAKDDPSHREKLKTIYAPRLAPFVDERLLAPKTFFANYQILRNLWHAARNLSDRVLFLFPGTHPDLLEELEVVLPHVSPALRDRVRTAKLEEVLARLSADPTCASPLRHYSAALSAKYCPTPTVGML